MSRELICVTGLGMRTPIGRHAAQSCASLRAGLKRFTPWPHFGVDGAGQEGLTASFTRPDLGDRSWVEKLLDLVEMPLAEALFSARLFELAQGGHSGRRVRVHVYLGTPYPDRPGVSPEDLQELTLHLAEDLFPQAPESLRVQLVSLEHVSGLAGIAWASAALQDGAADVCIVGGVDSLLDSTFLQAHLEAERLKIPGVSSGIIPGEAAAFLVLERKSDARRRGVPLLAHVDAVALEQEPPWTPEAPVRGQALTRALQAVLATVGGADGFGHVINDLNGERWRFLEWALIETRCLGGLPRGWRLWHPADSLGDVGAASASVAVGLALHAFQRGYARCPRILIASTSERGERAAISLSQTGGR
ncbi:beta-ketoacyl synthase N-terminal-like domain-containing protein [Corallococcus macrosporus]|uniref:3-oxoacyl-ACP synthase n=2 Tax=Myxococcaceae TaxID=31 RepID=A0A286NVS9_9BACT|nr:beta-ketoacyl synthase N-terminal-like domain-containing protein [Corallococcus macrosporus]AEI63953.1 3-oxoacyl-(acyl carrier protein) synthase [Corallococcus macrosporus]ATB51274.1 3-oxoacyl-ACP synthase [Corallococcus macrosporus DSM 14697]